MPNKIDYTNKKIGMLFIIGADESTTNLQAKYQRWIARCDCGKTVSVRTKYIQQKQSRMNCGCLNLEIKKSAMSRTARRRSKKQCPHCKKMFLGVHKQIYCTRSCKEQARLSGDYNEKKCRYCGVIFTPAFRAGNPRKYCSVICKTRYNRETETIIKKCKICSKEFVYSFKRKKFCSLTCKKIKDSQKSYEKNHPELVAMENIVKLEEIANESD